MGMIETIKKSLEEQGMGSVSQRVEPMRIAIKSCTPSHKDYLWGDTWFAMGLAKALCRLGHSCVVHCREQWDLPDLDIDAAIHIKGLYPYTPKPHCLNLIWLISHPELHTPAELNRFDAVFCASRRYLNHIRPNVKSPCLYLPQAADNEIYKPLENPPAKDIDVLFVGANYYRDKRRRIIEDILTTGKQYDLWIVGQRWKAYVDEKYVKADYVYPQDLPALYARAKIVLNDHNDTMHDWGFVNDRTYNLAALKAFQISDEVEGLEELGVVTYRTPDDLRERLDHYLANSAERQWRADITHQRCSLNTFARAAEQLQDAVARLRQEKTAAQYAKAAVPISGSVPTSELTGTASPKVSVVMACHNEEHYLVECLDSILAQTLTDWELLAVDDGSTDRTREILRAYAAKDSRIRLWSFDDCKGPYVRRNFAIGHSRAPFISIHDADDVMRHDKLGRFYEQIGRDPCLGVVGSWYRWFLNDISTPDFGDCMELPVSHEEIMQRFAAWTDICLHGSAIIRKSLFDAIGFFDEHPWGSDSFWLMKAGLYSQLTGKVRFMNIPECLTYIRGRADSQTGRINPHDPRCRRRRLGSYYMQKLCQIAAEHKQNPALDVERRLRECTIRDFIPTYGDLFEQWESQPLTEAIVESVAGRIRREFKGGHFVFTLILLNTLDKMDAAMGQKFPEFTFLRALSLYAIGHDGPAARSLEDIPDALRKWFSFDFSIADAAERKRRVSALAEKLYAGSLPTAVQTPSVLCGAEQQYAERMSRQIRDYRSRRLPNRPTPEFAVILRHYNKGRYLVEAVESVLAQTVQGWEMVIVDDASTDNSLALIQKYLNDPRIKLIRHDKNRGVSVAALTGIAHCTADLFGELDSDDMLTPDAIEKMVAAHRAYPDCGFIYSQHLQCDSAMNPLRIGFAAQIPDGKSFFETDSAGAFRTFKLEHYLKTALHNPDLRSAEDKDIILKMEEVSRLYFVPDVLYRVRELPQSCSRGPHQVVESRFTFGRVRVDACKRRSQRQAVLTRQPPHELFMRHLNELAQRDVKIQLYLSLVSMFMDDMLKRMEISAALKNDSREKVLSWIAVEGNIGRICETLRERLRDGRYEAMVEEITARFVPMTKKASLSADSTPLVSIILPAWNAARHIQDAIEGVLEQTYQNIEFIVINDGSTDATEQIVKRYAKNRVRLYSQPNAGVSAARNNGIRRAVGDFIITVDHDDIITPDYVERHAAMFEKHPAADLVYCDEYLVDAAGNSIRILEKPDYADKRRLISDLFHRGFPVIPFRGACIRKSVFDKIGLFDESLAIAEDYEIWLRFIRHGLVEKHLSGALYRRRMVENSLSRSHTLQKAQMHFSVVNKFAEAFEYIQLFPDTDWHQIAPGRRDFYARFLTAKVFVSLGQEYKATDASGFFTETAFAYAADHFEKCLELSPDDPAVLTLMHKCRQFRHRFSGTAAQGVAAAVS